MTNPKLVIVVTVSCTLGFYRGQLDYLREKGYDIIIISSGGRELEQLSHDHVVHEIRMNRGVSVLHDFWALFKMTSLFLRIKPDIVHGSTPKAGLISILAATMALVPVRFYTVRGLPAETLSGVRRLFFFLLERLTCCFATQIIVNSQSVFDVLKKENVCQPTKMMVIRKGSSNGVDAENRFNPVCVVDQRVVNLRHRLGISDDRKIIGFVGRLAIDKGFHDLVQSWEVVRSKDRSAHLLIIGSKDERDPASESEFRELSNDRRVTLSEAVDNSLMPIYYSAMHVLVLPTHREGFPNVVLEASSMELPIVATSVTGCVDAVVDGVTGVLVPPKNYMALAESILSYLDNPELCKRHGKAGRDRALEEFRPCDIWEAISQEYLRHLNNKIGLNSVYEIDVPK